MSRKKKLILEFFIFLFMMLCFYLISRGIYAKNLVQVDAVSPEAMFLNHSVSVAGNVSYGKQEAVFVPENLPISQVEVRTGDQVEEGDLLFICDPEVLSEMIKEEELEIARLKLQLKTLSRNSQLEKKTKEKQENRAEEDYQDISESAQTNVNRAKEDLESANEQLKQHENTSVQVTSEEERKRRQEAYQNYIKKVQEAEKAKDDAAKKVSACQSRIQEKEQEITALRQTILDLENGQVSGGDASASLLEEAKAELSEAEKSLQTLQKELTDAQALEEKTKQALQTLTENPVEKPDFSGEDSAKKQWEDTKSNLEKSAQAAGRQLEDANAAKEEAVKNASRAVEDAKEEQPADSAYETLKLELDVKEEQLEEHSLLLENEGQVRARQAGLITGVHVEPGEWTSRQAAFLFTETETDLLFEVHLSKEQKQYVSQNMQASITLGGSLQQIVKGKVDYLTESPLGDGSYDAAIRLEEGVGSPGENGILKTSLQSETYGCCIPLEALHKDSNQNDYVFLLVETEGILGTELSVRKQLVQVLDKNDKYAAIDPGTLDAEEKVITYATKEMNEGDIVRMRN